MELTECEVEVYWGAYRQRESGGCVVNSTVMKLAMAASLLLALLLLPNAAMLCPAHDCSSSSES